MISRKRGPIVTWIIALFVELLGVYKVTQSPVYPLYRAVDIVQFLGSGVCFGVVMTGVMIFLLRERVSP